MMEIIVCQECEQVLDYVESEKAGVLYAKCTGCNSDTEKEKPMVNMAS